MVVSALQKTVLRMRAGDPRDPRIQQEIAELEFRLADALPGGPVEVHVSPWGLSEGVGSDAGPPAEPWLSIGSEGVRGFRFLPGLEHRELRVVLQVLACDPPRSTDRRTQLWLADLPHVRFHCASPVRGGGLDRARSRFDPAAPPAMQAPLPVDDVRRVRSSGRLDWTLAAAQRKPEVAPEVVSDCSDPSPPRGASPWRWRRFVQLVLAGESSVREAGAGPECPPLLEGAVDFALDSGDLGVLRDIFAALEAVPWPEASLFAAHLRSGERLARLLTLDPDAGTGARPDELAKLTRHPRRDVRLAALATLNPQDAGAAAMELVESGALFERDEQERRLLLQAVHALGDVGARSLLVGLLERKDKADEALISVQVEVVRLLRGRRGGPEKEALRRAGRGWALHRDVRRAIKGALSTWEAA